MPRDHRAFTLIELLVVVTIIVVLLALLTPALDKAIYQAELAVDGANMHGTIAAVQGFTFDHKRYYPKRGAVEDNGTIKTLTGLRTHPIKLKDPILGSDDRAQLKGYVDLNKMLIDPLAPGKVDLENSDDDTHVYSSYLLYFGWSFGTSQGGAKREQGMYKMGDRFSWTDNYAGAPQNRFNVLISDFDRIDPGQVYNSHPDNQGVLSIPNVLQDKAAVGIGTTGTIKQTLSFWMGPERQIRRGPIDMNVGFDDGSVRRYSNVRWDEYSFKGPIVQLPEFPDGVNYPGAYNHLPTQ